MKNRIAAILFLLAVFFMLPRFAYASTNITTCQDLTTAGETYVLQNDVSSNGTCFNFISASNATLDLNGHTITYDNETPLSVSNGSFENALSGTWDTSNAPHVSQQSGTFVAPVTVYDGGKAMRWSLPATDGEYIQTVGSVTLQPNTTYSLSAMFYNGYGIATNQDNITMTVSLVGSSYSATQIGTTWRGFQYVNTVFTTGSVAVSYPVQISIAGASSSTGYIYADDVRILKAYSHAIEVGPDYHVSNNVTIENGAIVQGAGGGFASHAIQVDEPSNTGHNIHNLTIATSGVNSKPITVENGTYGFVNSQIHDNTINDNVKTIRSRDGQDGAVIFATGKSYGTSIYNNTITNGPQVGISIGQDSTQPLNDIYGNTISLQSLYSNDFAIGASGKIHGNIINCSDANTSCRGIYAGGNGTEIYNNIVNVQELPRNQEYGIVDYNGGQAGGCSLGGAYGIQMESEGSQTAVDVLVYGNTIVAYSNQCEAYGLRIDVFDNASGNLIHGNTFAATASGSQRAAAFKDSGTGDSVVSVYNNTFQSNRRWIYVLENNISALTLTGNKWETIGTLDNPFYPFEIYGGVTANMTFTNNLYGTGDQTRFGASPCFMNTGSLGTCAAGSTMTITSSDTTPPANPTGLSVL